VWGFDLPLRNGEAFARFRSRLQRIADGTNTELVVVATNLRQTRWKQADWTRLAHGCGLAGVALLLERRWSRVLIASTYNDDLVEPWGSHPLTDPLLSTSGTAVVHDGAEIGRVEKTRLVSESALALASLRVCWESQSDANCGRCEKCYRTMTTLWLLDRLQDCSTFPAGSFDPQRIARVYCPGWGPTAFMREVRDLAESRGRHDVVRAIERAVARSGRLARLEAKLSAVGLGSGTVGRVLRAEAALAALWRSLRGHAPDQPVSIRPV
jgi:hypothetical protein